MPVDATLLPGLLNELVERGCLLDPVVVIKDYIRENVASFPFGSVRIDWLKPIFPLYFRSLADAQLLDWTEGHTVRVATAEGLIVTKMAAFLPQDQTDIETLLTANRDEIDVELIREEWSPFAATEVERTSWLESAIVYAGRATRVNQKSISCIPSTSSISISSGPPIREIPTSSEPGDPNC